MNDKLLKFQRLSGSSVLVYPSMEILEEEVIIFFNDAPVIKISNEGHVYRTYKDRDGNLNFGHIWHIEQHLYAGKTE